MDAAASAAMSGLIASGATPPTRATTIFLSVRVVAALGDLSVGWLDIFCV